MPAKIAPAPPTPSDAVQQDAKRVEEFITGDANEELDRFKASRQKLRALGCKLLMKLTRFDVGMSSHLIEFKDDMHFNELTTLIKISLNLDKDIVLRWIDHTGRRQPLKNLTDMKRWLDVMWCSHPVELHLYSDDAAAEAADATAAGELAAKLFANLDRDGSNKLDALEILMAEELIALRNDEAEEGNAALSEFVDMALKAADTDHNASVTKNEFMAVFRKLSSTVNRGLLGSQTYNSNAGFVAATQARSMKTTLGEAAKDSFGALLCDAEVGRSFYGISLMLTESDVPDDAKQKQLRMLTVHIPPRLTRRLRPSTARH
jgi:hypothetical protein